MANRKQNIERKKQLVSRSLENQHKGCTLELQAENYTTKSGKPFNSELKEGLGKVWRNTCPHSVKLTLHYDVVMEIYS